MTEEASNASSADSVRICVLDTLSAAQVIADWQYSEWGQYEEGVTLVSTREWAKSCIDSQQIPSAFVCYVGQSLVGTSSVIQSDLPGFEHLSPWLANVYVDPKYRNAGIGTLLIECAAKFAADLGTRDLYLYTFDKFHYYARMGWRPQRQTTYVGKSITIMKRSLRS